MLANGLVEQDFAVNVIALNRGGHFASQLRAADIPVDVLQKRFRFDPLTYVRLRRRLRELKPAVVQSFLFSANTYVRLPSVVPTGTKVVVSERCVDSWKSGWQLRMDRMLSQRMDCMTANSQSVAEFYSNTVGIPADGIHVIANGIPMTESNAESQTDIRREFGLSPKARILGFIGRLAPQKCLEDLIWAFHLLHQSVEDAALVLIGDGPDRDSLADFARSVGCRDRVFFTGHRADAGRLVRQLDAFALASSFEGMSNSLMEAMAAGVPCVVSDIPANRELIQHEKTGLVFALGQPMELAQAARRLLTDTDVAQKLAAAAKLKITEEHSVDQFVQKYADLYRRICS